MWRNLLQLRLDLLLDVDRSNILATSRDDNLLDSTHLIIIINISIIAIAIDIAKLMRQLCNKFTR